MKSDPEVSILILGYNSARYLEKCIGSIPAAVGDRSFEILFLNNGTDDSETIVRRQYSQARILQSEGNIGFASGVNKLARAARGERLLSLNPDTVLQEKSIAALLDAAESTTRFAVLGGVNLDMNHQPLSITRSKLPTLGSIFLRFLGLGQYAATRAAEVEPGIEEVETLCGGFFLIDRDLWNQLGGFDEGFFLYCEEIDLFRRLRNGGYRLGLIRTSLIYHDVGSGVPYSKARMFYQTVGNAHYIRKHFGPIEARIALFLIWASAATRYVFAALNAYRGGRYPAMKEALARPTFEPSSWIDGFDGPGADPRRSNGEVPS